MNTMQMLLFPHPSAKMDEAIETIRDQRLPLPNHLQFVRELGANLTSLRPGSVILAAAHGGRTTDEVCSWVSHFLQHDATGKAREKAPRLAVLNTPLAENMKLQRKYLADAYSGALPHSRLKHTHEPQFQLEMGQSFLSSDRLQVISGVMAARSLDYYLLRDAHNFDRPSAPEWEALDQVRFIIEAAQRSGRTNVLLGRMTTVWKWLKDPTIAEAVTPCLLRPYDLREKPEKLIFLGLLNALDERIPWADGHSLASHIQAIDELVCGSPQRVNKWVLNALTGAKARGLDTLTWEFFAMCRPTPAECKEAHEEFKIVREHRTHQGAQLGTAGTENPPAAAAPEKKDKPRTQPGQCKPQRHPVGESAAYHHFGASLADEIGGGKKGLASAGVHQPEMHLRRVRKRRILDWIKIERVLSAELKSKKTKPLAQIARNLQTDPRTLRRQLPRLCLLLTKRHKKRLHDEAARRLNRLRQEIRSAVWQLGRSGEEINQRQISIHLGRPGLFSRANARKLLRGVQRNGGMHSVDERNISPVR